MRPAFFLIVIGIALAGCTLGLGSYTSENRQNVSKLKFGMTTDQVHVVMGQQTVRRQFNSPYRTAMYHERSGAQVDVFYYWTDGSYQNGITDDNLTPVVFRSDKVIGWGRAFFGEYIEKIKTSRQEVPVKQSTTAQKQTQTLRPEPAPAVSEEFWVTDPNDKTNPSAGIPMYPRSSCIGAVVLGVCKGEILHLGPIPKRCYGEMINGKCTGQAY